MKQLIRLILFSSILLSLTGCNFSNDFSNENDKDNPTKAKEDNEIPEIKTYKGEKLDLLVVGDKPTIREEKKISFTTIDIENLAKKKPGSL